MLLARNRQVILHSPQVCVRAARKTVILPGHPSKPHAQGYKPRVLAAEGQRLAVLLAVKEQVPLIAFQHWPGDFDGFAQAVFVGPLDEKADVDETVLHRELGVSAHTERLQMLAHQQFHRRLRRGLGLAGFGYAGHALPPVLPLGLCAATTTMGVCGTPLALASIYAFFALLSEKPASTRAVAGDSSLRHPPDTPRTPPRLGPDRCPSNPDTPSVNPDRSDSERADFAPQLNPRRTGLPVASI